MQLHMHDDRAAGVCCIYVYHQSLEQKQHMQSHQQTPGGSKRQPFQPTSEELNKQLIVAGLVAPLRGFQAFLRHTYFTILHAVPIEHVLRTKKQQL
jgi:hypothetical protein